ncbi:MAG: hypothetical protein ACRESZ_20500 [Methylococcales bacterium]
MHIKRLRAHDVLQVFVKRRFLENYWMDRAKSISINSKARVVKSVIDFGAAMAVANTGKKGAIQTGKVRTLMDQELDLVVGRSIN